MSAFLEPREFGGSEFISWAAGISPSGRRPYPRPSAGSREYRYRPRFYINRPPVEFTPHSTLQAPQCGVRTAVAVRPYSQTRGTLVYALWLYVTALPPVSLLTNGTYNTVSTQTPQPLSKAVLR